MLYFNIIGSLYEEKNYMIFKSLHNKAKVADYQFVLIT